MSWKMSAEGREFLEQEECCKLMAYRDVRGVLTIGYGHTGSVPGRGPITETMTITADEADRMLTGDLVYFAAKVDKVVIAPALTQGQFDMLVSLCFNIGEGNFSTSTLVKCLNQGDLLGVAGQWPAWCHAGEYKLADGSTVPREDKGLRARRGRELFKFSRATPQ